MSFSSSALDTANTFANQASTINSQNLAEGTQKMINAMQATQAANMSAAIWNASQDITNAALGTVKHAAEIAKKYADGLQA